MTGNFDDVRFLTVAEVAEMMRVSKMTVYRMVHAGSSPPSASAGPSGCRSRRSRNSCAAASPTSADPHEARPFHTGRPPSVPAPFDIAAASR